MKAAFVPLFLLLAACSAQQPPQAAQASRGDVAAKRAAGQEAIEPLRIFRAFGTEPFWNVNVEDSTLTYTTPEDQAGVVMQGVRRMLDDGVELTGNHDGKAFVLKVAAGDCNDGMSDNQYTLVSTFRYGEIDYKGCGEAAK